MLNLTEQLLIESITELKEVCSELQKLINTAQTDSQRTILQQKHKNVYNLMLNVSANLRMAQRLSNELN